VPGSNVPNAYEAVPVELRNNRKFDCLAMKDAEGKEEIQIRCDNGAQNLILKLALSKCPEILSALRLFAAPSH
jgi:hypothetical protein